VLIRCGLLAAVLLIAGSVQAAIPVKGGCLIGASNLDHAGTKAEAIQRIRGYALKYAQGYRGFATEERRIRAAISELMDMDSWTQKEVIAFTAQQRKLLYISVASQLANSRIMDAELPAYVDLINKQIQQQEVDLGCQLLPD
jgi:hypothetical protein